MAATASDDERSSDASGDPGGGAVAPGWLRLVARAGWGLAAAIAFGLAWTPTRLILDRILYEDFFYYLRVAEQAVAGRTVSLDGFSPTNGFHPLWMLLCVAAEWVASRDVAPHLVLTVAAALHLAQGLLLRGMLRRLAGPAVAEMAALFWILNYRVLACNLCGLETPLSLFALLAVVSFLQKRMHPLSRREALLFGALLGFAALSRFDLLLAGAFLLAWTVFDRSFGDSWTARAGRAAWSAAAWIAALVPWFLWSWAQSRTLLPNSSGAYAVFTPERLSLHASLAENLAVLRSKAGSALWWSSDLLNLLGLLPSAEPPAGRVTALLLLLVAVVVVAAAWSNRKSPSGGLIAVLALFAPVHYLYYALQVRTEVRYVMPAALVVVLLAAVAAGRLLATKPRGAAALRAGFVGIFLVASCAGVSAWQRHEGATRTHALHADLRAMAGWIDANLPPGAVVGALNAGILSEFSGRTVVNLDGVINDDALDAMRRKRLAGDAELQQLFTGGGLK